MVFLTSMVTGCFPSFDGLTGGADDASPQDAKADLTEVFEGSAKEASSDRSDDEASLDAEAGDSEDSRRPCLHVAIDRTGWTARASVNQDGAAATLDGDPNSRWSTMRGQQPGDWFEIDFGARTAFCEVVLDSGAGGPIGGPDSADIRISDDHVVWSDPLTHVRGSPVTTMTFDSVESHYARVIITSSASNWWDLVEINAFR